MTPTPVSSPGFIVGYKPEHKAGCPREESLRLHIDFRREPAADATRPARCRTGA